MRGVDNISVFKKMFIWFFFFFLERAGRTLGHADDGGATSPPPQAVVSLLNERAKPAEERGHPSILDAPSMFQVAKLVGETLREVIAEQSGRDGPQADSPFSATLILGARCAAASRGCS